MLIEDVLIPTARARVAGSYRMCILRHLMDNSRVVHKDELIDLCYPIDGDDPPDCMFNIISVVICNLRDMLRPEYTIQTLGHTGYLFTLTSAIDPSYTAYKLHREGQVS